MILAGVVIVLSGLAIWKPVQFQTLTALFGGYDAARYVHFFAMAAIVGFVVDPRRDGVRGAEEPARHDHRALRRTIMSRIRKHPPGVDPKLLDQGRRQAPARSGPPAVPARRREPRRAHLLTGCDITDSDCRPKRR